MKLHILGAAAAALVLLVSGGAAPVPPPVDVAALLADNPAPTLAAYHLFTDAAGLEPNAGLTPYDLNTPLFSDYARKTRYLFLPPGKTAHYAGEGTPEFPVGAVLVKTFAFPADFREPKSPVRRIETRLLIHKASGWVPLTYVWNSAGDEAVLKRAGATEDVSFSDSKGNPRRIAYHVPNVNQCKQCHSSNESIVPIGPKARNLNRLFPYTEGPENQLAHWTRVGILTGAPDPAAVPVLPRWDDETAPLEARARAYLEVNCAHCHSRGGLASNSGLYLSYDEKNPTARGIGKRPVAAGRGSGDMLFSIAPGHPEQSILLYRMMSTEPGIMMPQIGRTLADDEAVKLMRDYIASLSPANP